MNTHLITLRHRVTLTSSLALGALLDSAFIPPTVQAAPGDKPVTVTFADTTEDIAALHELIGPELGLDITTLRILSDGEESYNQTVDRKLKAFIGLGGQLRLQTGDSVSRAITVLSPASCLPGGEVKANLVTLGEEDGDGVLTPEQLNAGSQGDGLDLLAMPVPSSTRVGLRLHWRAGSAKNPVVYEIRWGCTEAESAAGFHATSAHITRLSTNDYLIWTNEGDGAIIGRTGTTPCIVHTMSICVLVTVN